MDTQQGIEIVPPLLRVKAARQAHGAQHRHIQTLAMTLKGLAQETRIEGRVVRHQHRAVEQALDLRQQLADAGRTGHHLVADAGQADDHVWDRHFRIDQRGPAFHLLATFGAHDRHLGDAIRTGAGAGGLEVDVSQRMKGTQRCCQLPSAACTQ